MEQLPFLRKLRYREHSVGWAVPCPGVHASLGFSVLIRRDEQAGRYRFECVEAVEGDLCGHERDLVRLLGLSESDVRIAANAPAGELRIVDLDKFADLDEPGAAAILGSNGAALIPERGNVMFYGDGGVGKTTLVIDLAFHLAAGDAWLGIVVPDPKRVLAVENEGPRPLFRKKLARKRAGWTGSAVGDRIKIFEQPWAQFSFANVEWRQLVAEEVRELEVDVVIVGPVTSSGMDEAGTMQQVRAFAALVDEVRELSGRPIAIVLVHHENKGGKVSGAWEGVGDTLFHVQQQGHGHVRLFIQKARWASEQHATTLQLVWAEGDSFALAEDGLARPERVWEDIEAYVLAHGGCGWNAVDESVSGQGVYKRRRRDRMLADGVLVNVGHGQRFELWHRDDPARPTLDGTASEEGRGWDAVASDQGDKAEPGDRVRASALKGDAGTDAVGSASPEALENTYDGVGDEPAGGREKRWH